MVFIKLVFSAFFLSTISQGISQPQLCTHSRGRFTSADEVYLNLNHPDQVCIRCLFGGVLQPGTIYIVTTSGVVLNDFLPDVTINADGSMLLDNPGNYLNDGDTFTCSAGATYIITTRQILFFDPVLDPDEGDYDEGRIDIEEGSSLTVRCTDNPNNVGTDTIAKTYQWFDSAGNSVTESTPFEPNNLEFSHVSRQDSGDYECRYTLTSSGETTRTSVTINVQYPPNILSITPENMTPVQGSSITFNCTFDSNPPVNNVDWNLNGVLLDPDTDPNVNLIVEETFSLLEVTFSDISYGGEYQCVVDNGIDPPGSDDVGITIQGECADTLYIMAFTSGVPNANSDTRHMVEITVAGVSSVILLPNLPGNDYQSLKGDLWKISFADDFSFDYCVRKNDIELIAIAESGNDGWNIETIVTFIESDNNFELATEDFNVFRWIDGDSESSRRYFELNLILN